MRRNHEAQSGFARDVT